MFTLKALAFLLMLCVVKSDVDLETMCKNDYRDMTKTPIDLKEYCSHNLCIEKCCGRGEILSFKGVCINAQEKFRKVRKLGHLISQINFSNIILSSWDGNTITKSNKNSTEIVFVINERDVKNCTAPHLYSNEYYILEDGSVRMQYPSDAESWFVIKKLEYCLDFQLTVLNRKPVVKLIVREHTYSPTESSFRKSVLDILNAIFGQWGQ